jgi:hypothetical protein
MAPEASPSKHLHPGEPPQTRFHTCGTCRDGWTTWQDFLRDPDLRIVGLQAVPDEPDENLLLFEHRCGTSISIPAKRLRHLLPDPDDGAGLPLLMGSPECGLHCMDLEDLIACDRPCANARDRRLLEIVLILKDRG